MTELVVVLGSVTPPGRFSRALAGLLADLRVAAPAVASRLLNLADYRLSFADGRPLDQLGDDSAAVVETIATADAVLLASPVYRASFTGSLKNLLDLIPLEALAGKPVGIVAMGATDHHFLGVDWQLRAVLGWFGALIAPTSVYLTAADFRDGALAESARQDLLALAQCLLHLKALDPAAGPPPLAARRDR